MEVRGEPLISLPRPLKFGENDPEKGFFCQIVELRYLDRMLWVTPSEERWKSALLGDSFGNLPSANEFRRDGLERIAQIVFSCLIP